MVGLWQDMLVDLVEVVPRGHGGDDDGCISSRGEADDRNESEVPLHAVVNRHKRCLLRFVD